MNKTVLTALLTIVFTGNLGHAFNRPEFSTLSDAQVAVGDKNQGDDQNSVEVADPSLAAEAQTIETEEPAEKTADTSGFSVRLVSLHGAKKVKPKSTSSNKTALASNSDENFTIQLSSSLTEGEAKNSLAQLQKSTLSPAIWMATAQVDGKTRYRVYYGHFKSMGEAQSAKANVAKESGIKQAFVQKVFGKLTAKND